MATITQDFPSAPLGRHVYLATLCAVIAAMIGMTASLFAALQTPHPRHKPVLPYFFLFPIAVPLVLVPISLYQRNAVRTIRIEDNQLIWGKKRHPLEGLIQIERDPRIMRWALRCGGNSGLGAIRGRFRSKRVGKFEAFLTDPEKAIVLRWPDKTLAVSPLDPEFFIYSVRSAAGLK
jgi:hypothetical protein